MDVVSLRGVTKAYKGQKLLDDVTEDFAAGQIHGIAGPNGSGKSVLFKMMVGFVLPDTGRVHVDERYVSRGRTYPDKFGVLIDSPGYLPNKTGLDNLLELARIQRRVGEAEVRYWMDRLGLSPDLTQHVRNYSLGMKQKLGIAQAMMEGQEVLILDEPFNGLDYDSVDLVRLLLQEHRDAGGTVIMTSHNREDMDLLADRVLRIHRSKLTATGSSE